MQKHVNLVDLAKSNPPNILLQILASIQKRKSPIKFAHLAEKSEKGSISNLSTKVQTLSFVFDAVAFAAMAWAVYADAPQNVSFACLGLLMLALTCGTNVTTYVLWPRNSNARTGTMAKEISKSRIPNFPNFLGLVLGCIEAKFCK